MCSPQMKLMYKSWEQIASYLGKTLFFSELLNHQYKSVFTLHDFFFMTKEKWIACKS